MWFQKISIPPPWKGFYPRPLAPLEIPIKLNTFVLVLENPLPLRKFHPFCGGVWIFSGSAQIMKFNFRYIIMI